MILLTDDLRSRLLANGIRVVRRSKPALYVG